MKVFKTNRRSHVRPLGRDGQEWRINIQAKANADRIAQQQERKPFRLTREDVMFFGKFRGMKIGPLCMHEPGYVHRLVKEGVIVATAEICESIQRGYDLQANKLSMEYGPTGPARDSKWIPITPQKGPEPTE
jgi:hypothetical protein